MRTSALRLSVVYAAIFAGALLALVFVIYLLTARFIDAEADTAIERDAAGFLEAYARGGVRTLAAEVNLRAENWSRTNAVYLLTDAQGFVMFEADRIYAALAPTGLLRGEFHVTEATMNAPILRLGEGSSFICHFPPHRLALS